MMSAIRSSSGDKRTHWMMGSISRIMRFATKLEGHLTEAMVCITPIRRAAPWGVASALSPAMVTALVTHFRNLNPEPLRGAPLELVAAGKKLCEEGVPSANIQPCSSCHGPEAKGMEQLPA